MSDVRPIHGDEMIRISYSPPNELDIAGTNVDWTDLRRRVLKLSGASLEVQAEVDFDPSPYDHALKGLLFLVTESSLCISIEGQKLVIKGSVDLLHLFADNMPWDADQPSSGVRYHNRFDRFGRESYVAEQSLDVVLSLRDK